MSFQEVQGGGGDWTRAPRPGRGGCHTPGGWRPGRPRRRPRPLAAPVGSGHWQPRRQRPPGSEGSQSRSERCQWRPSNGGPSGSPELEVGRAHRCSDLHRRAVQAGPGSSVANPKGPMSSFVQVVFVLTSATGPHDSRHDHRKKRSTRYENGIAVLGTRPAVSSLLPADHSACAHLSPTRSAAHREASELSQAPEWE